MKRAVVSIAIAAILLVADPASAQPNDAVNATDEVNATLAPSWAPAAPEEEPESSLFGDFLDDLVPFFAGLVGGTACYIGVDALATCICEEDALRAAIANDETNIDVCFGEITLDEPIDITGKSFTLACQAPFILTCDISGGGKTRLFQGSPVEVTFEERIRFIDGDAKEMMMRRPMADEVEEDKRDSRDETAAPTPAPFDPLTSSVGGAMALTGGKVFFTDVAFVDNKADAGGALYIGEFAEVDIGRSSFLNNKAKGKIDEGPQGGGAIHIAPLGFCIMEAGIFSDNKAEAFGGAVFGKQAQFRANDVLFEKNEAKESGGAYASFKSVAQFSGTVFVDNKAKGAGGNDIYIADDLEPRDGGIGSFVYCDPDIPVSFCNEFETGEESGKAILEMGEGNSFNTNCVFEGQEATSVVVCEPYL